MTDTRTDDQPGFVAEKPEHCFACCRLIHPGQTYYLTIEQEVLCADCALDDAVVRVREDLAVEVKRDRLVVRHGAAEVEVLPGEVRHLVNALAEAAARLVELKAQKVWHSRQGALLGDAAGFLLPITGEGISYAPWIAELLAGAFQMTDLRSCQSL